jgi:hypothetical protein
MLSAILRNLRRRLRMARRSGSRAGGRAPRYRPQLEGLEDRLAPATWTGMGCPTNPDWSNPANWLNSQLPQSGDDILFPAKVLPAGLTSVNDLLLAVHDLTFAGTGYNVSGRSLTLTGDISSTGNNLLAVDLALLSDTTANIAGQLTVRGNVDGYTKLAALNKTGVTGTLILENGGLSNVALTILSGALTLQQESVHLVAHGQITNCTRDLVIENSYVGVPVTNEGVLMTHGSVRFAAPVTNSPLMAGAAGATLIVNNDGSGSTFDGTLTNDLGSQVLASNTTFNGAVYNQGSSTFEALGDVTWEGAVTNLAGSQLTVNGNLTSAFGFRNDGKLMLSGNLTLQQGALVMAAGSTLLVTAASVLAGALDNQSNISVDHPLSVDSLANSGTLQLNAALTVNPSGYTPNCTNTGTINLGANTIVLKYYADIPVFGTVTGTGTVSLLQGAFTLATPYVNPLRGPTLEFNASTVSGTGTLTNPAGGLLRLADTTVSVATTNQGTLAARGGADAIQGAFTTAAGSILTVVSTAGPVTLSVGGFENDGEIDLTGNGASKQATLKILTGSLTNAGTLTARDATLLDGKLLTTAASKINVLADSSTEAGSTKFSLTQGFTNIGSVVVKGSPPQTATLNLSDSTLVNDGSLSAAGNAAVNGMVTTTARSQVEVTGSANTTVTFQNGFTNNGLVQLDGPNPVLAVTSGELVNAAGATLRDMNSGSFTGSLTSFGTLTVDAAQTFQLRGSIYNHEGGTYTGPGTLSLSSGTTANLFAPFRLYAGTLQLDTATVQGPGGIMVTAGTLLARGADALNSQLTTTTASTIQVAASTALGARDSTLTLASGFTNNGTIELKGYDQAPEAILTVTAGTLTNVGTLHTEDGAAFNGILVTTASSHLRVEHTSASGGGGSDLTLANGFTNFGLLEFVGQLLSLTITSGTLVNATGATIDGTAANQVDLHAAVDNRGTFYVGHDTSIQASGAANRNSNSGRIIGDALVVTGSPAAPESFINTGTITLTTGLASLTLYNTIFTQNGTLNVTGTIRWENCLVTLGANFVNTAQQLQIVTSAVSGAPYTLTNPAGHTLDAENSTFNVLVTNMGTLTQVGINHFNAGLT